ncbi:MAG: peptide ABC transporter substrate-binding protein [Chloroflexi bacterium]|nr:peptide ABC transporter substrate-binding protein [Chloroflexota bacterium]
MNRVVGKKLVGMMPVSLLILTLIVAMLPAGFASASDAEVTVVALYRQNVPVQRDTAAGSEISSLDPAIASDQVSITPIENIFLGLTDYDAITSAVNPEIATSWVISPDGLLWTFNLRTDVNWMRWDPASDSATVVRPVVAGDFVYGIKRTCDPRLGGYYGTIAAKVIKGCDVVNQTSSEAVTDDLVYGDTTAVSAPDDTTLVVELQYAAGFFFSMTPMWMLRAVPQEIIEEFGDEWTAPGNIVTNGPYFIDELTRGVRRVFVRNENLPADLFSGTGNIEIVNQQVIEDGGTIYSLYLNNQLDSSGVPQAELQNVLGDPDLSQQVIQLFQLSVFYFAFAHDKAPFDNVHARRAFAAVIDRQAFIDQVLGGSAIPMIHFTPPGMAHAPAINEIGVGFDPDYAKAEMEAAGYPNCEGFPNINMTTYTGAGNWADFWAAAAEEYLGCDPSLFNVEQLEFSVLLEIIRADTPTQDRPNAWTLGWGPDYGDANNWVNDVLSCTADNAFMRPCTEVDDLINEAARESDPAVRDQLYGEIEEAFFGPDGDYPIAPLFMDTSFVLIKPWFTGPHESDGLFGGAHWGAYTIDMAAKLAARGE